MPVSRRALLQGSAGLAVGTSLLGGLGAETPAKADSKKVVIGAFADGGLTPFKQKILPLAKADGFDIQFLEDEYGVTLEKWFADAQSGAGQYDLYLLDDPWVPQFGAAKVLEDLGGRAASMEPTRDWISVTHRHGLLAASPRPAGQGLRDRDARARHRVPFVGDLQTLTYRNDVYTNGSPVTWDDVITEGKAGVAAGKIKYPVVFRGVSGNPIVTSWYPVFLSYGGKFFDDKWNVTFNSAAGKASAEFFVGTMKQNAPKGVVEFDSDQEGAAILGGDAGAVIEYSGNALKADDPTQTKVPGKLDFGIVPKQVRPSSQIGIFIAGIPKSAPNKAEFIAFLKWYTSKRDPGETLRGGLDPRQAQRFPDPDPGNRLIPCGARTARCGRLAPAADARLGEGRGIARRTQQSATGRLRRRRRRSIPRRRR